MASKVLHAIVDDTVLGDRLDVALSKLFTELSRRDAQRLCAEGRVLVSGRPAKKSDLPRFGAPITIELAHVRVAVPQAGPLTLRLVTDHWVVVAKPPLQPTAPKHSAETGTLANALVAAFPEMATIGHRALEPGLLHRLDNGTSGLIVAARSQVAFEHATIALKQSRWHKSYLAVVRGEHLPDQGRIEGELEPWPGQPQKVRPKSTITLIATTIAPSDNEPLGPAVTRFETLASRGALRQVRVVVGPAFRHQIRAHFAAVGAVLLNDEIYGAPREPLLAQGRHALHAARVAWEGEPPFEGFDVTEPLERDLMTFFNSEDVCGGSGYSV
jgi:23S rRNA pseudouridine1911/1915/1917 synthase